MRPSKHIQELQPAADPIHTISDLELVKAKNAIEQFLYSCSHSLRAPLKSIAGLVHLLKRSKDNPEFSPELFLDSIEQTVSKMELVLNELELFLSNSREQITIAPVNVQTIVDQALAEMKGLIAHDQIQVAVQINQEAQLFNDASRIGSALTQLVSNAVCFSDPGKENKEIRITINIDDSRCAIDVSDNGIGIKPSVLPNIFKLFYRGSEKSRGSGVGLYIVREVVNKLKGMITIKSTEGEGSSFMISIPNLK